jgi:hypothetical protein
MSAEVYNPTKPAAPRRALLIAGLLLLFVSALAADMSWRRTGRIHPPGWGISFQAPRGWMRGMSAQSGTTAVITFHQAGRAGNPATLAFWRVDRWTGDDLQAVCELILGKHGAQVSPSTPPTERTGGAATIGPTSGFELADARRTTVVRAAQLDGPQAYAVSLSVSNGVIDEHEYNLFDTACRSIEPADQ